MGANRLVIVAPTYRRAESWLAEHVRDSAQQALIVTSDTAKIGHRREPDDDLVIIDPAVDFLVMGGWLQVVSDD